jgi:hypothetical protein
VLTRNTATTDGGGAINSTLNNCIVSSNSAVRGGGSLAGKRFNSVFDGNSASQDGGGAYHSLLVNCTLVNNSARYGGGAYYATLNNCIVYYNTATSGSNYSGGTFNYSCTTPMPTIGVNNLTNAPAFVNHSGGNFHLLLTSSGIDAGGDAYVEPGWTDLDGKPRLKGAHVDMGAYESDYLLSRTPVMEKGQGTGNAGRFSLTVPWSETNRQYRLLYKTNLAESLWQSAHPWLSGNGSNLSLTDLDATNQHRYYRLESTNQ